MVDSYQAYANRNQIIREIFPEFDDNYKFNIYLPQNLLEADRYNFYTLRIDDGQGNQKEKRLSKKQFLSISSNHKKPSKSCSQE